MFETEVFPFANQDRTQVFGSLAHDFTARVSFYLTGSYTIGSYDAEQTVEDPDESRRSPQKAATRTSARSARG